MSKKSSTFATAFEWKCASSDFLINIRMAQNYRGLRESEVKRRNCGRPNSQSEFIATSKFRRDSVAQQVEHIPFKDGVLGSSPS